MSFGVAKERQPTAPGLPAWAFVTAYGVKTLVNGMRIRRRATFFAAVKTALLAFLLAATATAARAQLTVGYYQSSLPFVGVGYGLLDERLLPEVRIDMDNFLENGAVEVVGTYAFFRRDDYEAYAGTGLRFGTLQALPALLGVRAYPFAERRVGVQLEAASLLLTDEIGDGLILRGSIGVHVRLGGD